MGIQMRNEKATIEAIVSKVKTQEPQSQEAKLMFVVFENATRDLFTKTYGESAAIYLRGKMDHLEIIGINSDWVKRLFKTAGIDFDLIRLEVHRYDEAN